MKLKRCHTRHAANAGMSLVELLVALGIATFVIGGILTMASNAMRTTKATDLQLELEGIRRYMTEAISCDNTLRPLPAGTLISECAGAGVAPVRVFDRGKNIIINKPQTRYGSHMVRATCPQAGGERRLHLEHLYVTKDGGAAPHPVSGAPSGWLPLFNDGLSPCGSNVAPKELTVYDDLEIDFPSLALFLQFAVFGGTWPYHACGDSMPTPTEWYYETSLAYHGFAKCPRGYSLVGGGLDCSMSDDGDPDLDRVLGIPVPALVTGMPFRRKGVKLHNDPLFDEFTFNEFFLPERMINVWRGTCCLRVNTVPLPNGINIPLIPIGDVLKDRVYARCVRNST